MHSTAAALCLLHPASDSTMPIFCGVFVVFFFRQREVSVAIPSLSSSPGDNEASISVCVERLSTVGESQRGRYCRARSSVR